MSLQIIKSGILDSIQDCGRYGYQHLGINPGGAMDVFSAQLSNALLGKQLGAPVIEIHFPASQFLFEVETIICIAGADFGPEINQHTIPVGQPVVVSKKSILRFTKAGAGVRCYLSILHGFMIDKWLGSYSTNLKAEAGGFEGRALRKDRINYKTGLDCKYLSSDKDFNLLPWKANRENKNAIVIRFVRGNQWDWLSNNSKNIFFENAFKISNSSDRMGYRLTGENLKLKEQDQLVSSPVTFGTIQLLPDGKLIVLMADHQTTGGYPVIGNVISADLCLLSQKKPGDEITFLCVENKIAENELMAQQNYLQQLRTACKFKMETLLNNAM